MIWGITGIDRTGQYQQQLLLLQRRGSGWPQWLSGERQTYENDAECLTWTKPSTNCDGRFQLSLTKNGSLGLKPCVSLSPTLASWIRLFGARENPTPQRVAINLADDYFSIQLLRPRAVPERKSLKMVTAIHLGEPPAMCAQQLSSSNTQVIKVRI